MCRRDPPDQRYFAPALALALFLRPARPMHYVRVFLPVILAAAPLLAYNLAVFHGASGQYPVRVGEHFRGWAPRRSHQPGTRAPCLHAHRDFRAGRLRSPRSRFTRTAPAFGHRRDCLLAIAHPAHFPVAVLVGGLFGSASAYRSRALFMVLLAVGWQVIASSGWKWAFAATALYCCFVQALGVYCYPKGRWDGSPVSVNDDPSRASGIGPIIPWSVPSKEVSRGNRTRSSSPRPKAGCRPRPKNSKSWTSTRFSYGEPGENRA